MKVIDKEKNIAYIDSYSYVIHVPAKKHYELRLHKETHSLLIGWGTLEKCLKTAKKIAQRPHYFKKLYQI